MRHPRNSLYLVFLVSNFHALLLKNTYCQFLKPTKWKSRPIDRKCVWIGTLFFNDIKNVKGQFFIISMPSILYGRIVLMFKKSLTNGYLLENNIGPAFPYLHTNICFYLENYGYIYGHYCIQYLIYIYIHIHI